ncbi:uncharacterized protein TNCV_962381 [Trichonephila clavipes]|nr:uncharacterized protein TNCV_962381 [Trichonephila clavipes]
MTTSGRRLPILSNRSQDINNAIKKMDVETWMACDAEDCGFQILNGSVQEESDPVDDETDEDEDNNDNESGKDPSNADAFFALRDSYGVEETTIRVLSYSTTAPPERESQRPCSENTKVCNGTAKNK